MAGDAVIQGDLARAVIDPASYAEWDTLLDTFDHIRSEHGVVKVLPEDKGVFDPFWLVTSYDDVMRISKDNQTFLNHPRTVVFSLNEGIEFAKAMTGGSPHMVASLVTFDAPVHMKYRKLTQEWFMPKNLRSVEDEIRALAEKTVQKLVDSGPEVDFVPLVSAPYPLHVVMQIMGVPEEDEPRMLMLTQQMFGGQDDDLNQSGMKDMTPEQITQLVAGAVADFEKYFAGITAEKRANPTGDVASTIANATVDGEPLNDRDMMGYYIILAAAGHDTTSASTAGAMLALAKDPEQFARVKADRSLLPGIVEEAIRWTSPVQHFMRTAAQDTEIGGRQIRKGDWLMINYVAANHDPAQFDDPRRFDAARSPSRHLAFGAGAHQCLGLHLARLEMRILFEALLDRLDSIALAGDPQRSKSTFVGGLKTLPLRITPS
ncbi:cytochrome P450 [Pontixanthobacter aestiaquae]|uniref:Cytochrome P450 n=1 Tax=Pontixanthobacter aestiaquae TaxID=1509367 RepID=A0A844Z4J1_9SPHN|nr:cytochrome P450 [Pontixanthobacter aestiaquae]MDN3646755.1 cytochrome P450 [Pontixanthobacter aestiaquae]MXO82262.1 cytochrome P450 [Pontixanthobacter aestiaquae]